MRKDDGSLLALGAVAAVGVAASLRGSAGSRSLDDGSPSKPVGQGEIYSATLIGTEAQLVTIEVDLLKRLPAMTIVGLSAGGTKETAERVRSAFHTLPGEEFPRMRVAVLASPADLPKNGPPLDLAIALGVMRAVQRAEHRTTRSQRLILAVGELSLGGEVRPVRGIVSIAELALAHGLELMGPASSIEEWEAFLPKGLVYHKVRTLHDAVVAMTAGAGAVHHRRVDPQRVKPRALAMDGLDAVVKEAVRLSADRPLLLIGPNAGRVAQRIPSLLPSPDGRTSVEIAKAYAAALLNDASALRVPFRAPHHTVQATGLTGDARALERVTRVVPDARVLDLATFTAQRQTRSRKGAVDLDALLAQIQGKR